MTKIMSTMALVGNRMASRIVEGVAFFTMDPLLITLVEAVKGLLSLNLIMILFKLIKKLR